MRSKRKKYLQDFLKNMQGRDAKGIQTMRVTIRKQDWLESFKASLNDNTMGNTIDKAFDKEWREISKAIKGWYDSKSRATTWKKVGYKAKGGIIVINIRNSSATSKKWYNNAIISMKKPLNKYVKKKAYVKRIIGEHGRELERLQQAGAQGSLPGYEEVVQRPGSAGNNMQTSLVKAMGDVVDNSQWWCGFVVYAVQNYLHAKINSRIDKRKTKNSIHRNHVIEFIISPSPPSKQSGAPDRADKEEFTSVFRRHFNAEMKKKIKDMKSGKTPRKEIAAFVSDSPDIFDEFADFGDNKSVEIMEQEARRAMRRANAQMTGVGKKTKTRVSFAKQLKAARAEKKIGKAIEVARKNSAVKTKLVASQQASPPSAKKGTGGKKVDPGFRMDKEGILIKDMINNLLPRAIQQNMGTPRLNNQTGRFSKSAKVDNVVVGPRGGLYIGYTYPQRPYGVFEPGHGKTPWANQYRDPRHIIGMSIRQIVAVNMKGQAVTSLTRGFE